MSDQTVVVNPSTQNVTTCGDSVTPTSHALTFNPSSTDSTTGSSSLIFTDSGMSVPVTGYTTDTSGTMLYFVNDTNYVGLGIDNGVDHYISSDSFVQFNFCDLISKFVPGVIPTLVVESSSGNYQVYGSNSQGSLGDLLISGATATQTTPWPITVSGVTQTFPIPSFEGVPYQFISIIGGSSVVSFLNYTSYDDANANAQIVCCPEPCPPPVPPQPELPPLEPTYVEVGLEVAPVINLTVDKPRVNVVNYANGVPKKRCCVIVKKKCCDRC